MLNIPYNNPGLYYDCEHASALPRTCRKERLFAACDRPLWPGDPCPSDRYLTHSNVDVIVEQTSNIDYVGVCLRSIALMVVGFGTETCVDVVNVESKQKHHNFRD